MNLERRGKKRDIFLKGILQESYRNLTGGERKLVGEKTQEERQERLELLRTWGVGGYSCFTQTWDETDCSGRIHQPRRRSWSSPASLRVVYSWCCQQYSSSSSSGTMVLKELIGFFSHNFRTTTQTCSQFCRESSRDNNNETHRQRRPEVSAKVQLFMPNQTLLFEEWTRRQLDENKKIEESASLQLFFSFEPQTHFLTEITCMTSEFNM